MSELIVQFILSIVLFFVQNWIGNKAYSKGYIRFSLLDEKDEALSVNYVIKVFGPIIFIVVCVAIFQYYQITTYVDGILNVVYFYVSIRILLVFLYERAVLVSWYRIALQYTSILIISTIIYNDFIDKVDTLLPDFSQIKNEIWLLIILFIYKIGNGIEEPYVDIETARAYLPELKSRKKNYILKRYKELTLKYKAIIDSISQGNQEFNLVIMSILIFENFNRPRIIRFFERVWVRLTKRQMTQGIMQVSSNKLLSDAESVKKGTEYLWSRYSIYAKEEMIFYQFRRTIKRQCPDKKYIRQILFIVKAILDNFNNKHEFEQLISEIKDEFDLYDYDNDN